LILLDVKITIYGGERGIRTLETLLTLTHFPGVLLQPLGHLTVNCCRFPSCKVDRSTACSLLRAMAKPYLLSLRDRPTCVQNAYAFSQPLGHLTVNCCRFPSCKVDRSTACSLMRNMLKHASCLCETALRASKMLAHLVSHSDTSP
jgi:hypothetical protein